MQAIAGWLIPMFSFQPSVAAKAGAAGSRHAGQVCLWGQLAAWQRWQGTGDFRFGGFGLG